MMSLICSIYKRRNEVFLEIYLSYTEPSVGMDMENALKKFHEINSAKIEWNDNYSVGISKIDGEHKELFDIVNKVIYAKEQQRRS